MEGFKQKVTRLGLGFNESTLVLVLRMGWADDRSQEGKQRNQFCDCSDPVRDYIKFKIPVTHPRGEMRLLFRKTNLEFREGIWTAERNLSSQCMCGG